MKNLLSINSLNSFHGKQFFYLLLFVSLLINQKIFSQAPDTIWTKTIGGSNVDIGYCVQETSDGGFIITGYTRSFGSMSGRNLLFVKTDSFGNTIWVNGYGGNNDDEGNSVVQTSDGGFVACGYTKSYGSGGNDVYLIKVDANGNQLWDRIFGGPSDEEAYSMVQTSDGGFLLAGATSSFGAGSRDIWLIKTDQSGNQQWTKTIGGLSSDGARSIAKTSDGGYIITGWTLSYGPGSIGNLWLVKTDSLGNMQWNKFFGGTDADRGLSVKQTIDGGYIATGYTASFGAGLDDMYFVKTDGAGNTITVNTFGATGRDYGNCIIQSSDGGNVMAGYTLSFGAGGDDMWIVKTDNLGLVQEWNKTLGGTASDVANYLIETSDGSFVVVGHTLSFGAGLHDVWLIKSASVIPVELTSFTAKSMDNNVHLNWTTATELNNKGFEIQRSVIPNGARNLSWEAAGFVSGKGTTTEPQNYSFVDKNLTSDKYAYRLKQIDFDGSFEYSDIVEVEINKPEEFILEQNYPNPFNPATKIKFKIPASSLNPFAKGEGTFTSLKVFDVLGNEVAVLINEFKQSGYYEIEFDASKYNLTSGIYFYQLKAGSFIETRKTVYNK
ncbi:T9SS type A sorting domain-containing protein [Ignavibacterium sp.]|uniref:T9SS type A sorting domain-containing protein n=1 Tax=Ignavibacterium sp. TaxID=2651167 RepID=UPI00307ECC14